MREPRHHRDQGPPCTRAGRPLDQRPEQRDAERPAVVPVDVAADHRGTAVENVGRSRPPLVDGSRLVDEEVVADVPPAPFHGVELVDRPDPRGRIPLAVGSVGVVQHEPPEGLGLARPALAAGAVEAQRLVGMPASPADEIRPGRGQAVGGAPRRRAARGGRTRRRRTPCGGRPGAGRAGTPGRSRSRPGFAALAGTGDHFRVRKRSGERDSHGDEPSDEQPSAEIAAQIRFNDLVSRHALSLLCRLLERLYGAAVRRRNSPDLGIPCLRAAAPASRARSGRSAARRAPGATGRS